MFSQSFSIMHWLKTAAGLPDAFLGWLDDCCDGLRRRGAGDIPVAILLLLPALLILGVFIIAPMFATLYMSFYGGRHGIGPFLGAGNYLEALRNPDFRQSLLVTVYYVLGVVPCTMLLSLLVAYGLYRVVRFRSLLRSFYFLPYVTSAVAAAMVWRSLFNPQSGVVNASLRYLGAEPLQWLLESRGILHLVTGGAVPVEWGPSLALTCIILFDVWHSCGFMIVVFLAGLCAMPAELEEAARIDGAGGWRLFRHVTVPLLSPTIFFLFIVGIIKAFQAFNSFYALTHGGSMADTRNLILYIYSQFYLYGYWGYAAATAMLLLSAIIVLTIIQWRFLGRRVFYS